MNVLPTAAASLAAVYAAALAAIAPAAAAEYAFDTKGMHASIQFRVKHLGFSWLTGRFDKFDGTITYDAKNPAASKVKVEIDPASLSTNHAERDKHLRGPDYLDVVAFPKASFESSSVTMDGDGKAKIAGKFTMHGVTKDIVINAERIGGGPDPWGGNREGFSGTAKLVIADYGFKKELGPASKEVELFLDVEGVEKTEKK